MKKLIFILFAFIAISTIAQTKPSYPTVKLTMLANGSGDEDVLVIGSDKQVKKVPKSSIQTDISGKVDKEVGKGLSTNDYTTTDKTKLLGIASGAEVNVNADWNASSGDAQILNKPIIPSISGLATETYVNSAVSTKENNITAGTTLQYWRGDKTWQTLDKTAVGLSNVDNTSDLSKPISVATQTALNLKANDNAVVHLTGDEIIAGTKTFNGQILIPSYSGTTASTGSINISNLSSGRGIRISNESNGVGIIGLNNSGGVGGYFSNYSNGQALTILNNSTGIGLNIINTSSGPAAMISSNGSGKLFDLQPSGSGNIFDIVAQSAFSGYVLKYSKIGSGLVASIDSNGNFISTTCAIRGGTSSQFLKADGSVDSNSYHTGTLTSGYIPKATGSITLGNSLIYDNGTNVGIGTTAPEGKLHITGKTIIDDGATGRITFENTNIQNDIYSTTTAFGAYKDLRYTANIHIFRNAGTEAMRISGSNVGIGTTAPSEKLEVNGNVKATSFIKSGGTSSQYLMADGSVSTGSLPYKSYVAIISQSGTSAPTVTVLQNELGGSIVWTRDFIGGVYYGTLTGAFTSGKTVCFSGQPFTSTSRVYIQPASSNKIQIDTRDNDMNADSILGNTPIEIRVYN